MMEMLQEISRAFFRATRSFASRQNSDFIFFFGGRVFFLDSWFFRAKTGIAHRDTRDRGSSRTGRKSGRWQADDREHKMGKGSLLVQD